MKYFRLGGLNANKYIIIYILKFVIRKCVKWFKVQITKISFYRGLVLVIGKILGK